MVYARADKLVEEVVEKGLFYFWAVFGGFYQIFCEEEDDGFGVVVCYFEDAEE